MGNSQVDPEGLNIDSGEPREGAAQTATSPKEERAGAALVEGEVDRIKEIVDRLLETIPEQDRSLNTDRQVESATSLLISTEDNGNHLYSSADKFGNLPPSIVEAQKGDRAMLAARVREYADDPKSVAAETDKLNFISKSGLPESVQSALVSLIMQQGEHSPSSLFRDLADKLENSNEDSTELFELARQQAASQDVRTADAQRQTAARQLLDTLYHGIATSTRAQEMRARATGENTTTSAAPETSVEASEAKTLSEISWMHVEDDEYAAEKIQNGFRSELGVAEPLATARSVSGATDRIKEVIDSGKALDLIVLDKSFLYEEDDEIAESRAWKDFMSQLEEAAKNQKTLENTKVVIMSGDIDPSELKEIQEQFPRIIGALQKHERDNSMNLAGMLVQSGVVRAEGKALEGHVHLQRKAAAEDFGNKFSRAFLVRLVDNNEDTARQEALDLANEARSSFGLEPMTADTQHFTDLMKNFHKLRYDIHYGKIKSELLFKE